MDKNLTTMEKRIELSMLYDFYGELLKNNQRQILEGYFGDDLSLAELADEQGISRQGIYDTVKRCSRQLEDYEAKLHLIARFEEARETVHQINNLTGNDGGTLGEIRKLSEHILELL